MCCTAGSWGSGSLGRRVEKCRLNTQRPDSKGGLHWRLADGGIRLLIFMEKGLSHSDRHESNPSPPATRPTPSKQSPSTCIGRTSVAQLSCFLLRALGG